jgi:hypothetical protein
MAILGSGKGGDSGLPNIMFAATTTWTPSTNFEAIVYCIGGGGSGAFTNRNFDASASGGGAGGTSVSRYSFLSGTAYTITIGAGGNGPGISTSAAAGAGNAGGASSIAVGGSAFMTANGGGAGAIGSSAGCSGGAGGSSSGGNISNYTGGSGGACDATKKCSGGGAVGLWMNGSNGQAGIAYNASAMNVIDFSFGGALNQYQEVGQYAVQEFGSMGQNGHAVLQDIPIMMSPFPELFCYNELSQLPYQSGDDGSPSTYTNPTNKYTAGMIMNGGGQSHRFDSTISKGNGYYIAQPTGPFEGGKASIVNSSNEWAYGSRVSMGAGSGACLTQDSSGRTNPAKGGSGIVLLFPTTMG